MDVITTFVKGVRDLVVANDGENLRDWLLVEPDSPPAYHAMAEELRRKHPRGSPSLMALIEKYLPEEDSVPEGGSTPWPGFHSFMHEYLSFWRDANDHDLMDYHERFLALLLSCVSALKHPSHGAIMIQTGVSFAQSMVKLVTVLNERPDLTAARGQQGGQEDGETRTFVDESCELIKEMFSDCCRPLSAASKKAAVYLLAGMALRLLFICGRPMVAWTLLPSLEQAPPLAQYPVAQRVTYLYYLGMVMFLSDHYPRARAALAEAYRQVPPHFAKQRRLILTYLIPANILCGRFPTEALLRRPEAQTLALIFRPITAAIRKGNFVAFQHALAARQAWLLDRNILFPIMYRARPLLWRSLTRRVFLLTHKPTPSTDGAALPAGRKAVTLDLNAVHTAASYIQHLLEGYIPALPRVKRAPHTNSLFLRAVANSTPQPPDETTLVPGPGGPHDLRAYEGLVWGNMAVTIEQVQTVVIGLVAQGLMFGFVSWSGHKFAIQGIAKTGGGNPVAAGWPANPAEVIMRRLQEQGVDPNYVPGWVR